MLSIELLADGGIRLTPPGAGSGLASLRLTREWVDDASRQRYPIRVSGEIDAPLPAAIVAELRGRARAWTIEQAPPPRWPHGWSSLQTAAHNGLDEVVADLLDRGAPVRPGRGASSPYRLAMRSGHVGVLKLLREAGAKVPAGSHPPAAQRDGVVLRQYLPAFTRWVAAVAVVAGVAMAVVHWAFLVMAVFAVAVVAVANYLIGRTRIAVDGPSIAVRQLLRWQQPFDLRRLVAVDYAPAIAHRLPAMWRFLQHQAGPRCRRAGGFEAGDAERLQADADLRVVSIASGRGFLSPGFERHIGQYVTSRPTLISANARAMIDRAGAFGAGGDPLP